MSWRPKLPDGPPYSLPNPGSVRWGYSMRPLFVLLWAGCLACSRAGPPVSPESPATVTVTVLHTNDEHGWIEAGEQIPGWMSGGAAEMMGLWEKRESYPNAASVALSSGDMWTGPAISTWSQGEATVEAMNAMGYRAAALGNHEFDFGLANLAERRAASKFAYLAANMTVQDGSPMTPAEPFRLVDVSGIRLGIVGLANRATPTYLVEQNTAGLAFGDYAPALRRAVPEVRRQGADLVVVIAHECTAPLADLARTVPDLNLPVMFGGHCHAQSAEQVGHTWVIESGYHLGGYSRTDIELDARSKAVRAVRVKLARNAWQKALEPPATADRAMAAAVHQWSERSSVRLGRVLGYTETGIREPELYQLVTRSWLSAVPGADLALSNGGGFRQEVPPGEITVATVLSVLPFENTIVSLVLTGAEVTEDLSCCGDMAVAQRNPAERLDSTKRYRVLINSYMYSPSTNLPFARQDPRGKDTGIAWREPVIHWIEAQKTSRDKPLVVEH
jgi:5'-nucleotidase / UDP-sugar diphosphatase